jgi:excisionase family DNA binding protein
MQPDELQPINDAARVAAFLKLRTTKPVYKMIESGQLHATFIGNRWRIRREDVEAMLAGQ